MKFSRCASILLFLVLVGMEVTAAAAGPQSASRDSPGETGTSASHTATSADETMVSMPGPLRSAMRMAAISQKASPEEIIPLLARNIYSKGYQGWKGDQEPTEFLTLLRSYFDQAEELEQLAGKDHVIRISSCDQAKPLLHALGYQLKQPCGDRSNSLETAEAERAFLTVDSGFPLTDLEEALRTNHPFSYAYESTQLPVLFREQDWIAQDRNKPAGKTLIDVLMGNGDLARLYWALAKMDVETRTELKNKVGLEKLAENAAVLDFYGSFLRIRNGRVQLPGGPGSEKAWKVLAGADPGNPGEFVTKLMTRDEGWLAAYFDAVSRVNRPQQAYFTQPEHMLRFYQALRGRDPSPGPARPVFRSDPELFLLMARLELDNNGQPMIPGNLAVWQQIVRKNRDTGIGREWSKRARNWSESAQLLEALVGLTRVRSTAGATEAFLMFTEMDRGRFPEERLSPTTVRLLADHFERFRDQYKVFVEFHGLNNESISRYVRVEEALDHISDSDMRANAIGTFQADVGLWQILARQGEIPDRLLNHSWQAMLQPFFKVENLTELYDAGQIALNELLRGAEKPAGLSQNDFIALLAGPKPDNTEDEAVREELAARMRSVMNAQRLVSLDTILELGSGLNEMAAGKKMGDALMPLAEQLRQFELPRPLFTSSERLMWAAGMHSRRHAEEQIHTDLTKVIRSGSSKDLAEARGRLAPFLRDTLVGLNYAYYEPPGANVLHHNALFVRSHDFSGDTTLDRGQSWRTAQIFGAGMSAGGGAHLVGSLADLPYVLASAEQDFLVPENKQALIWQELVPTLMTDAVLPRWWGVTRNQLEAVTLYQQMGEELLRDAANNAKLRPEVTGILVDGMIPRREEEVEADLTRGDAEGVLKQVMPSETFYLAAEFRSRFPEESAKLDGAARELDQLTRDHPQEVSLNKLSERFGVPHPVLTQSYGQELLNLKPLPAFMGYASRLLAETWDSNNLYWARLAYEKNYAPALLNTLVPQLTHRMVEKIFATDFEDWPALLRALHEAGDEFRRGQVAQAPAGTTTAEQ